MSAATLPKRTRENIAACAIHGLSWWSEAPGPGMLWAVNDKGVAFYVKINRSAGTSCRVVVDAQGRDRHCDTKPYTVPSTLDECAAMIDCFPDPPPERKDPDVPTPVLTSYEKKVRQEVNRLKASHQSAADKRALKKRIADKTAQRDAEMDAKMQQWTEEARAKADADTVVPKPASTFAADLAAKLAARGLRVENGKVIPA